MKTGSLKATLVFAGAAIFTIIFWNEKLGLNTAIFDVFIIASIFYLYPFPIKNNACTWLTIGHLVTVAAVIIHNTVLSKIAFSTTLLLLVVFSQYIHRSIWYAGGSVLMNYILAVPNFFQQLKFLKGRRIGLRNFSKPVRMLIIPLLILSLFAIVYALANTIFSDMAAHILLAVQRWFSRFFYWFPIERFLFFFLGIFVTAGLILKSRQTYFSDSDSKQKNHLSRKRNRLQRWQKGPFADLLSVVVGKRSTGILALKSELIIGAVSLVLLNILLLFINIIDIKYVWLGFTFKTDVNLAGYVHEGAGLLIFSIVLAMLLLLFFFRGNLNFYRNNKWLRYGAYLWILQNMVLVVSVFVRDYYYISHYGLAYKRIGLLFFLLMVLTGLVTVFLKIRDIKTSYYLLRINAWAGIFLLVAASVVHWDETIARYNLDRKASIPLDVPFLLSLSDKTLPLLEENKDVLVNNFIGRSAALEFFEFRKKKFQEEQLQYTWLSWNAADAYVKKALNIPVHISSIK